MKWRVNPRVRLLAVAGALERVWVIAGTTDLPAKLGRACSQTDGRIGLRLKGGFQ